ncbi:hypothetical protein [Lentibacillus amyloliquefaciens]|uniref:Uncharacterized protein n=1 Tax=Lentibacillus amyloliquefaciens TaxID=1472767 RepID=A0A0U4E2Q8_9BACI|nr:hypothetical protein [Lentibacillus amyloliquefaciens]ALX47564.1 hypothetical protein AOX59_02465 [Lentibacillus amyloliquefaciens]
MIANNDKNKQLPDEINMTFKELNMLKHLRNAGITKYFGFFLCLHFSVNILFKLMKTKNGLDGLGGCPMDQNL